MNLNPVLLMGGSGAIGHQTVLALRKRYPDLTFLIGGRDLAKARKAALEMGGAEGVALNPKAHDLGLGERPVSAVVVLYMDHSLAGLRFAQARGIPHLSVSSGVFEIAPQIAAVMHRPGAAPVVLGYEWLVGATTVPTLELAKAFAHVDSIRIGALVDEQDAGGPAVAADFEHLSKMMPRALTRRGGTFVWREGDEAKAVFRSIDGSEVDAAGFSSIDVAGLAAATGAEDVQFDLAMGVSSSRRAGGTFSTEIVIELAGQDPAGNALRTRHAVMHPGGAAELTGMSIALLIERLTGLDGEAPTSPGLYFPYQLLDAARYLARLERDGGKVLALQP